VLVGGDRLDVAALVGLEPVADELDLLDAAVAADLDGGDAEAQNDPSRLAGGLSRGVLTEHLEIPLRVRVAFERGLARGVELEICRVDDHVGTGELAELDQLGVRERGLGGAAARNHDDLADAGVADRLDRGVGGVGRRELLGRQREHPGDVDGDVAGADHDRALAGEVELEPVVVGVAVVPGDELGGGPGAGQVLAGDVHAPVGLGADGVDDRVVEAGEVGVVEVAAGLDVADEAEAGPLRDLLERARDGLDLRVVGRDAEPDEAPRGRQPLDHVDLDGLLGTEERAGRVEAGGAGADDGDAQRPLVSVRAHRSGS